MGWYFDMKTKQVKNWATGKKKGKWCWSANPRTKVRNYMRITKCRRPRAEKDPEFLIHGSWNGHGGKQASQAWTQFDWNYGTGYLRPYRNTRLTIRFQRNKRIEIV